MRIPYSILVLVASAIFSLLPFGAAPQLPLADRNVDPAERQRVIEAVAALVEKHYFDHEVAEKMADTLKAHEQAGNSATGDGNAFAHWLTQQLRDVSQDMHFEVIYSADPLPEPSREPSSEGRQRYRRFLEQQNCTFEKVAILPHNIGYFKLNSFPDPEFCAAQARAAMAKLNDTDAVIFDLRDNHGGMPAMTALLAAYLFDHPEYWYLPREAVTEQSFTESPVPRSKLAGKPVYVLTSHTSISGAEQFAYNLKMLKRATIVGETTAGAAHAGVFHRIDDHFGAAIPEVRPVNPYGKNDWEGVGVEPDAKVKSADALESTMKLAAKQRSAYPPTGPSSAEGP